MARFHKPPKGLRPDEPLRHPDHKRPITRRDFIAQGLRAGLGITVGSSIFSLFANPRAAYAALSSDLETLKGSCGIATQGAGKIPFICIDLAGGANIAGSNVLVGRQGGQLDFLTTAGYSKLGIPGDMIPPLANPASTTNDFINTDMGLAFHSESAFLRGIVERAGSRLGNVNGAVIPAQSDNDTGNNPHNPMYGIYRAGADGSLVTLIGSRNTDSGGNSMAPATLIDPSKRPTKVDRPSDVTGLVDTGDLIGVLNQADAVAVMESIERISAMKLDNVDTKLGSVDDKKIKDLLKCGYVKTADIADRFGNPTTLDPALDPLIVGPTGIFDAMEFANDREFQKTASVMKMVISGFAGAGTITLGGYDYHTGDRATGELRDLRAGRCMGACIEYAARVGVPLMLYVFSDGSVASNGMVDNSVDGGGKGVWTGDNSSTAASFFLVYNPVQRPVLRGSTTDEQARRQQIGYFRPDGSVETASSPAANNVNLLVNTVILNYMSLHYREEDLTPTLYTSRFPSLFPNNGHGLGNLASLDQLTAFAHIVDGTI